MERFAAIPELARRYPGRPAAVHRRECLEWRHDADTEAAVIAQFLARQGLPDGRVMLEDRARSTRDNAILSLPLARPQPGETWLLVTSAMHMPRSIGVFRSAGWPEMQPWPVDYRTTGQVELAGRAGHGDAAGRARCRPPTNGAASSIIACWDIRAASSLGRGRLDVARLPIRVRGAPCRAEPWFFSFVVGTLLPRSARRADGQGAVRCRQRPGTCEGSARHRQLRQGLSRRWRGPANRRSSWQAMRLSRNRNWGDPADRLHRAAGARGAGRRLAGLLVGDMAQPRGGPMRTGHASHQIGLDADIWLTPMPEPTADP